MRRRGFLSGMTVVALAAVGGAAWKLRLFGKHYAPTPYDDLLRQITDREPAARLGAVVKAPDAATLAARLRRGTGTLAQRAPREIAAGRMLEAGGWIVPESVALYAALAAKV